MFVKRRLVALEKKKANISIGLFVKYLKLKSITEFVEKSSRFGYLL